VVGSRGGSDHAERFYGPSRDATDLLNTVLQHGDEMHRGSAGNDIVAERNTEH